MPKDVFTAEMFKSYNYFTKIQGDSFDVVMHEVTMLLNEKWDVINEHIQDMYVNGNFCDENLIFF